MLDLDLVPSPQESNQVLLLPKSALSVVDQSFHPSVVFNSGKHGPYKVSKKITITTVSNINIIMMWQR